MVSSLKETNEMKEFETKLGTDQIKESKFTLIINYLK